MIIKINISDNVTADLAMHVVGMLGKMIDWDIVKIDGMDYTYISDPSIYCKFSVSRAGNVFINVGKAE